MDENPYQAPSEHASEDPDAGIRARRRLSLLFVLGCLGLAAFFLSVAALGIAVYRDRPDRRGAAAILWALLNTATWCVTAWATWTRRGRLRKIAIFADLAALLSIVAIQ
ncbi:MAG TPA: hypothetical protein VMV10_14430 [Pirellulales bacterium]|nr:hypothetical protein [Pirellulales bacterium]